MVIRMYAFDDTMIIDGASLITIKFLNSYASFPGWDFVESARQSDYKVIPKSLDER